MATSVFSGSFPGNTVSVDPVTGVTKVIGYSSVLDGRDGLGTLSGVEVLRFKDKDYTIRRNGRRCYFRHYAAIGRRRDRDQLAIQLTLPEQSRREFFA